MERSLDIDLHLSSMADSDERAVGGVTSGLITLGEEVSWRARHLGIWWSMTSRITVLEPGRRFVDEQVRGPFKRFRHEHRFDAVDGRTRMVDTIDFDAPFGPLGSVAERLVLARYLERLIRTRNEHLLQG
ncbi:SRPBCC family protein [Nocardioides jishulii]|uniref:SRPBCC family protein n=2 Tax=Nocardioides jishulii TaxID=2575440 RepID=A0A4U2YUY7_9ACTN|nr:SRPBCC family protein [Nocardioides jishulii]TKI64904.1 SRPBCC family protein [Nocardioides jishulii]